LYEFFDRVIQEVAEPALKIYLYHFPAMTGVPIARSLIERLVSAYPGTVAGLKDSGGDWLHMKSLCRDLPEFRVYAGTEQYLVDLLREGGAGCISATANLTCLIAGSISRDYRTDVAEVVQDRLTGVRKVFEAYPFIPALKFMMAERTGQPAWRSMRPPLVPLSEEEGTGLKAALQKLNFPMKEDEASRSS
jgi:4-hydroxy-tetrahydrodipicolinate synthase